MAVELGTYKKYLPILKWRQGEYQALLRLDSSIKRNLYPLFVIPPVEYDFEEEKPKKTAEEHVEKLAKRYKEKWGKLPSLIDIDNTLHLDNVSDGRTIPEFIFDEIASVTKNFSPVTRLDYDHSYVNAVKKCVSSYATGLGIRVALDQLANPSNITKIQTLMSFIGCIPEHTDLIVDFQKGSTYEPNEDVILIVSSLLNSIPQIKEYRSIYIAGTSLDLNTVKKPGAIQDRNDWIFYQALYASLGKAYTNLGFGDYTIETPEFSSFDMRLMNPAAKLVYSYEDKWVIYKGSAFRDDTSQMKGLCKKLVTSKNNYFYGAKYSKGDTKIYECSQGVGSYGNLGTWKEVAVSHHLTLVVYQNASLLGFQTLP
ncbi:beta family protein [Vibrio parahaemolyticus]|uniref:beta family protein n=1 Tax=Vibrio TaxID=662 RepID=UPI0003A5F5E9|nr:MULTISPECIES: beta family protein [Vibrio]AYO03622.1 hypothetical protein D0871_04490 [Vibrio parahaemolyticus]EGR1188846.1 hypothetical protein [Vibrio parahaemolyticus]EGR1233620.1 hypothetical protein [Vibrio parahaemolyticus]EIN4364656.1 beta family protein [Vibrio parahaemolyticus]EJB8502182.1 beta family protein [Vibrio parahaemolyticus]